VTLGRLDGLRGRLDPPGATAPPSGPWRDLRPAAVLVPLLTDADGAHLLFTVRSRHLPHHAGQIAFPGGAVEGSESVEQAARREAFEEVGLEVPAAAVLGRLSPLPSPAGYLATPVVASLRRPERLALDPGEVEEAFTVPLGELEATAPECEERLFRGAPRTIHRYRWHDRDIWGFTGNVLREFLGRLAEERGGTA
jgi:8-oxo-dGTP pyrophosphatase MutT (NUDIX family)